MAEGIFRDLVRRAGLESSFRIDSCGTGGWHSGELPDPRTRAIARKYGFELPSRARQLRAADFRDFDYILAMDGQNLKDIKAALLRPQTAIIRKIRDFDPQAPGADVPDPYYGGADDFEAVYEMLLRACTHFLAAIRPEA